VEVIKREFIKNLEKDGSPRLKGLHQYNEILTLEELGVAVKPPRSKEDQENANAIQTEETTRSQQILQALSGRHQLVSLF
jgi:Ser/Thr protein kinase RdoA (MazF antagonist)